MNTNDLIAILAKSPRRSVANLGGVALLLVLLGWAVTYLALGLRPDFMVFPMTFFEKTLLLALGAGLASLALRRGAMPLSRQGLMPMVCLLMGAFMSWMIWEWMTKAPQDIIASFHTVNFRFCLIWTSVSGLVFLAALTSVMRLHAPADVHKASALTGTAAALLAGLAYSIHCPIDSPTFIAVAYGAPVLTLTLLARVVLPRFLRW